MSAGRPLLDLQSLSARFSTAVFEAGLALYRSQQVLDCTISRVNTREWSLAGTVRSGGKSRSVCDVSVELEASPEGELTFFSGTCSCSTGRGCQHSAALAVKAVYQSAVKPAAPPPVQTPSPAQPAPTDLALRPELPPSAPHTGNTRFPTGPSLDLFGEPAGTAGASTPAAPLPEPETAPDLVLQRVAPSAHLHITAVPPDFVEQRGLLCATLRFEYAGVSYYALNDYNPVLVDIAATGQAAAHTLLLHRDLQAEHAAHHRLHALGLSGDSQGRFLRTFISEAQQQPWLEWLASDFQALRDAGFEVSAAPELSAWIARADGFEARMEAEAGDLADQGAQARDHDTSDAQWFRLSLGMNIAGERRNILPLLPELLARLSAVTATSHDDASPGMKPRLTLQLPPFIYLRQPDGHYWQLPCEPLRPWLQALLDLLAERGAADGEFARSSLRVSRMEALRLGTALHRPDAVQASDEPVWQGAEGLRAVVDQLAGRQTLPEVRVPAGLRASLRPYQLQGLRWLQFLRANRLGGILADDMGLGKTLQTLAHILAEKEAGRLDRPVLILAPVSLMGNWRREASRFTPSLRVAVMHGHKRHRVAARLGERDVVIAPYSLLQRDRVHWEHQAWHLVVLDEAQNIKNANSQAARHAAELRTRHRLCLSGTPMENHLGEVWSLFDFLMPDFLGSTARFKALYRTPIEKQGDSERLAELRRRVTPFMLRRHKRDVAADLPDKQESVESIVLGDSQADLYEAIRLSTESTVRETLANKGLAQSQLQIMEALVRLRQVCCDPRLVPVAVSASARGPDAVAASAKLDWLMQTLPEMLAEGRRVLLFSQFTSMLELIEDALRERRIGWVKLTGQSKNRDALIEKFTSGAVPLFLISLKAGGVGLNLPQADTVIHYDPWWNPAIQNQATDRAHRIGQTQPVLVYKLVAQGTIEERILALQARKSSLADGLFGDTAARGEPMFTEDDLAALLEPLGG